MKGSFVPAVAVSFEEAADDEEACWVELAWAVAAAEEEAEKELFDPEEYFADLEEVENW